MHVRAFKTPEILETATFNFESSALYRYYFILFAEARHILRDERASWNLFGRTICCPHVQRTTGSRTDRVNLHGETSLEEEGDNYALHKSFSGPFYPSSPI